MIPGKSAIALCELIESEMDQCDDTGKRIIAHRLLEFLRPWQIEPTPTKLAANPPTADSFDLDDVGASTDHDVKEALALAEEIESLAGDLPEEGQDFGRSVTEKAADIAANIEAHNRVTDAQFSALQNMLDGLQRWFHD